MSEIDSLEIKIKSEANSAANAIDKLESKLNSLASVLGNLNSTGVSAFTSAMEKFSGSMQKLQSVKMSDFTRTAKGITKISEIDGAKLQQVSNAITPLANSLNVLGATSFDGTGITNFVNAITRLANSNVQSLNSANFVELGNNINKLTSVLQNAKSVDSNTIQITNAVARLASAGDKAGAVSTSLPTFGKNLRSLVNSMSTAGKVSSETVQLSQAIALLANAGKKAEATASGLGVLATELKKFFQVMSTAPAVSGNIVQMTNAIASLANASRGVGNASRSLTSGLNGFISGTSKASKGSHGLASAIGKLYAEYFLLFRAFRLFGKAIDISSDLTEVQNVVDNTFGDMKYKVEDFAQNSIKQLGMSELSVKQYASRFQAMGTAMGITAQQVGDANAYLAKQTDGYIGMSDSLADVSLNLTKLTADMASFYNVSQEAVAQDLESIYTGMTRPLRQYGLDLTEATLKEWAMRNGLNANIDTMTQAEKTMLRYQYVMANTAAAQGDFARTSMTWANQIRILQQQLVQLGGVVGTAFINMLKPLVVALNKAMSAVISFAETVVNALGVIFGWKLEITSGSIAQDFEDAATGAGSLADNTGKAADNAKKLKQQLQGFNELNVLTSPSDSGSGSGGSGGGAGGTGGASDGGAKFKIVETESAFKSQIDTLYKLGEYIGDTITNGLNNIKWDEVYQGARNFGTGLADFLNGLISPELFGAVGSTIAKSLNTAIYSALSFGETFDWADFGLSIATGINNFFADFDFKALAQTLNVWVDGIKTTIITTLKNIKWSDVLKGGIDFLTELDLDTLVVGIAAFKWMHGGKELTSNYLKTLLSNKISTGIGSSEISISNAIKISLLTATIGFKIGNWLYNNTPFKKFGDAVASWLVNDNGEISISKTIGITLTALSLSLGAAKLAQAGIDALKSLIGGALANSTVTLNCGTTAFNVTGLGSNLLTGITASLAAAFAGFSFGEWLYYNTDLHNTAEWVIDQLVPSQNGDTSAQKKSLALDWFAHQGQQTAIKNAQTVVDTYNKMLEKGFSDSDAWALAMQQASDLGAHINGEVNYQVREVTKGGEKVSYVTGETIKKTSNKIKKSTKTDTSTIKGAKDNIVSNIQGLANGTIKLTDLMNTSNSKNTKEMSKNMSTNAALARDGVKLPFSEMNIGVSSSVSNMSSNVSKHTGSAKNSSINNAATASNSVKSSFSAMALGAIASASNMNTNVKSNMTSLKDSSIESAKNMSGGVNGHFKSMHTNSIGTANVFRTDLSKLFVGMNSDSDTNTGNIKNTVLNKFQGLWSDSNGKFNGMRSDINKILGWTNGDSSNNGEAIRKTIVNKFNDTRNGANSSFGELEKDTRKHMRNANNTVGGQNWYGLGTHLVTGLKDGINRSWQGSLVSHIIHLASGLTTAIRKAFKINSPSKLWRDKVGVSLTEGLSAGITKGTPSLLKDTVSIADNMSNSFFDNLELARNPFDEMQASMTATSQKLSSDISGTAKIESANLASDISDGITSGMSMSQAEQNALLREQNDLLRQLLSKDTNISANDIFESVKRSNRQAYNRTGTNPLVY